MLKLDSLDAGKFGSGYGYNDQEEETSTNKYYRNQVLKNELGMAQQTESFALYDLCLEKMPGIIDDQGIRKVINFGVSYAHVDSLLARLRPDVSFVGVDRLPATKEYNEKHFGELPNLSFRSADILDYIQAEDCQNSLLFHMRTAVLLPPSFLARLYQACQESGIRQIVLFEPHGLSWATGEPYIFSDEPKPSQVFRSGMFIHNYPGLLKQAGYQVAESQLQKTGHQDDDYRILYMAAQRQV